MIHIVKGVVSEAEVDVFLELSCIVYDPVCVLCILSHFSCVDSLWPMDCSPPGSSVLRILQAGLLEWVAMPPSRGSSWLNTCLWWLLHWQAGSLSLVPHWKPYDPTDTGSLIPVPFLNPACISLNSWFMYCWSLPWRILRITLLACEMSAIV